MEIDLNKLKELTESLTTIHDIAVLMDIPEAELRILLADPNSEVYHVYHRTKASCALNIRKLNIELAMNGSPVAAQEVAGYLKSMNQDE